MSDINKIVVQGRLTRDAELRYIPSGTAVTDLSLASNRFYKQNDERKEETVFVDVTVWGKTAEVLAEYLTKGTHITVVGRLKMDRWETDEGVTRSKISVVSEEIALSPRGSSESNGSPAPKSKAKAKGKSSKKETEEVPF